MDGFIGELVNVKVCQATKMSIAVVNATISSSVSAAASPPLYLENTTTTSIDTTSHKKKKKKKKSLVFNLNNHHHHHGKKVYQFLTRTKPISENNNMDQTCTAHHYDDGGDDDGSQQQQQQQLVNDDGSFCAKNTPTTFTPNSNSNSNNKLFTKLRRYGISGILSYGLLNTVYYLTTFFFVWFYIAPAPGRLGYAAAVERFLKVMAMVWVGSQVTKLARAAGALALAPLVSRGLTWFTRKYKFESEGKAFMAIVGFCFGLALLLFFSVTLLWA